MNTKAALVVMVLAMSAAASAAPARMDPAGQTHGRFASRIVGTYQNDG